MKRIRLLSTISILFFIYACKTESKRENKEIEKQNITTENTITQKQVELKNKQQIRQDSINKAIEDSLIKAQQIQDSITIAEKKKKEELKVIIDGKVYYKKHKDDYRLGNSFIFRDVKSPLEDYDIRTKEILIRPLPPPE